MPFQIQGFDPGSLLSGLQIPDTTAIEARRVALEGAKNELSLFPQHKQELENKLAAERDAATQRAIAMQERKDWLDTMQKYGGDYAKARQELSGKLGAGTLSTVDKIYDDHAKTAAEVAQKRAEARKTLEELDAKEREDIGGLAARIAAEGYNPASFDAALDALGKAHADTEHKAHIDAIRQSALDNPDRIKQIVDPLITPQARAAAQEQANKKATQIQTETQTRETEAKIPGETAKSDIEVARAKMLKGMTDADWQTAIDNVVTDKNSPLYQRTTAEVNFYRRKGDLQGAADAIKRAGEQLGRTETAVATAKATEPIKINLATAEANARNQATQGAAGLTEDDYKMAGEQYGRTGVMPALGRDSVTRGRIEHYKNQWAKDNGFTAKDLVTMQAAYKGDVESLKKFQAQRDQIVSFEQTAQKNLDMMVALGKKLADTGSKWLNKPLRSINRNLLSTDEQAAFDAAQLIARNEVAKVTSGGGLGGVVSETSQREMKEAMGTDPSISNMIAVAKILKQDMANRHASMDATLGDIRANIGGARSAPGQTSSYKKIAVGPNGHRIGTNDNGNTWYDVQTGQKVQ